MENEFLPGTVRQRIRDLMERNGLTQSKLAKYVGVGRSTLNDFLKGETETITSENVVKIAGLFNVSTDFVLGLTNDPRPKNMELKALGLSRQATENLENRCFDPQALSVILEQPELIYTLLQVLHYLPQHDSAGENVHV